MSEHERVTLNRAELTERIAGAVRGDGTVEAMPGLHLARASAPSGNLYGGSKPSLCVVAQGRKELYVGSGCYPPTATAAATSRRIPSSISSSVDEA